MSNIDDTYTIKIEGEGINLSYQIDSVQFARIFLIIKGQTTANPSPSISPSLSTGKIAGQNNTLQSQSLTPISIREFLNVSRAQTNTQKIATFAVFLRDYMDYKTIPTEELKKQFENAAEQPPKNFSRDLKNALKYGWIAESTSGPGNYFITSTGEKAVESKFTSQILTITGTNKGKGHKTSKKSFPKATPIRNDVFNMEIDSISKNSGINYWNIKKKGDKILWILAEAKYRGVQSLNYKEIETLSKKIGEYIGSNAINGLTEAHKKNSRIATPMDANGIRALRIHDEGIEYLKKLNKNKK